MISAVIVCCFFAVWMTCGWLCYAPRARQFAHRFVRVRLEVAQIEYERVLRERMRRERLATNATGAAGRSINFFGLKDLEANYTYNSFSDDLPMTVTAKHADKATQV